MEKIIQIAIGGQNDLYCLTADGKVYTRHLKDTEPDKKGRFERTFCWLELVKEHTMKLRTTPNKKKK